MDWSLKERQSHIVEALFKCYFEYYRLQLAYKIDSEQTPDYTNLFLLCKVGILQVTVNKIEVISS